MKQVLLLIVLLLLSSCELYQGHPAFTRPDRKDLVGTYAVANVSWSVAHRSELKRITIDLSADGSFWVANRSPNLITLLIPGDHGTWELKKDYWGIDLGSRSSWAVRFVSADGSHADGLCLKKTDQNDGHYRLFFHHHSEDRAFDSFLVMDRHP